MSKFNSFLTEISYIPVRVKFFTKSSACFLDNSRSSSNSQLFPNKISSNPFNSLDFNLYKGKGYRDSLKFQKNSAVKEFKQKAS